MNVGNACGPIGDDEILLRRISETSGWYNPDLPHPVAWEAFRPNEHDVDGLSVWRARFKSSAQCASENPRPGRRYFVLKMRAGELRQIGVRVDTTPELGGLGHASLSNISKARYDADKNEVRELAERIAAEIVHGVDGPYGPFDSA